MESEIDVLTPVFEGENQSENRGFDKVLSPIRLQYQAQVQVIQNQIGDLESIRFQLGLSQRKMSQLLLVDPSAWTRWVRGTTEAPPHIWRALQWYLALKTKIPGLTNEYFLGPKQAAQMAQIEKIHQENTLQIEELRSLLKKQDQTILVQNLEMIQMRRMIRIFKWALGALLFIVLGFITFRQISI